MNKEDLPFWIITAIGWCVIIYAVAAIFGGCQSAAERRLPICENALEFAENRIAELEVQVSMLSESCIDYD